MNKVSSAAVDGNTALVLIEKKGDEPRVDSRALAAELGVKHKHTIQLIKKYTAEFESLGSVRFESAARAREKGGGVQETIVLLNEDQCTFLLTLSRNTTPVVALKLRLTKLFGAYKNKLNRQAERRASVTWQEVRDSGKSARRQCMGTVEKLVDYARAQGSQNAGMFFLSFSKLTNARLGIEVPPKGATRDALDAGTLAAVQDVELVEAAAILEGMSEALPYKEIYPLAKARVEALNVVRLQPAEKPKELAAPTETQIGLFE